MTATLTEPTTATHVGGYIRLTRDESLAVGLSAPAQRKGIQEYAERAKLTPLVFYEETKAVGGDVPFQNRLAGRRLIAAIQHGECKHIITRDLDRLARDVKLGLDLVALCQEHNVTIHTFTGPIPLRSASDKFAFHVRSAAAEFEKNQTGDRVRKAKREAVEQGRWQGPPAYGYTSQARRRSELIAGGMDKSEAEAQACTEYPHKARLYIHEQEAATLRLIYKLSLDGWGSRRIVAYLNANGYKTRNGCYWSTERLSRTLNNPAAAGFLTYDVDNDGGKPTPKQRQKRFKGSHEPIITLEQWEQVQKLRDARRDPFRRRGEVRSYPLSGVLRCECGAPMRGRSIRLRDKQGRYVCTKATYYGKNTINGCKCEMTTINAGRVHEVFWPKLRELLTGPDLVDRLYTVTQKILRDQKGRKVEDRDLGQQIRKLEGQINTWYGRHDGTDSEVAREAAWNRIQQLMVEKKRLEASKAQKESQVQKVTRITRAQIEKYLSSLCDLLADHGGEDAKQYIQSLVTHHGLQVRMTGPEKLLVSLAVKSPGTMETETVGTSVEVPLYRDKYAAFVQENQGKHRCSVCGKPIEILRRHCWLGIPKHHHKCWARTLAARRNRRTDGLLTGAGVARLLKVGETTIGRWRKSGKLPKPVKVERGTNLWERAQVADFTRAIRCSAPHRRIDAVPALAPG